MTRQKLKIIKRLCDISAFGAQVSSPLTIDSKEQLDEAEIFMTTNAPLLLVGTDAQFESMALLNASHSLVRVAAIGELVKQLETDWAGESEIAGVLVDFDLLATLDGAEIERLQRAVAAAPMIALTSWMLPDEPDLLGNLMVDDYLPFSAATTTCLHRALLFGRQRRRGRRQMMEREAHWRSLLEQAPDQIMELDATGQVVWMNRPRHDGALAETGPRRWEQLLPPDQHDRFRENLTQVLNGETPKPFKTSESLSAGTKHVVTRMAPVRSPAGDVVGTLVFDTNDEERAREHDLFVGAFETAVGAMLLIDSDGVIIRCNDRAESIFGYSKAEFEGKSVDELLPKSFRAAHLLERRKWVTGQGSRSKFTSSTFAGQRKDGTEVTLNIALRRIEASQGIVVLCAIRDITERTALEAQLRQAQKMEAVGRLAGGVAHDFNNLLTAITSFCTFARDDLPADAPARDDLGEVLSASRRAADLTRQLLTFSRHQPIDPQPVQINERLRDLARMIRRLLGASVTMRMDLAPRLPRVWMDPSNFEQIVVNLCVNASDAMPDGGPLTITTRLIKQPCSLCVEALPHSPANSGCIELLVTDGGDGMDAATAARVFEPFFTTKPADRGTGLGLSTCYGIVQQAGGAIEVHSVPGEGTTIRVRLPATAGKSRALAMTGGWKPAGSSELVLVVDDDPAVLRAVQRTLSNAGFSVLVAASSEEALEVLAEQPHPPALLLTDLIMPNSSGLELAAEAKTAVSAVMLMTGHVERTPSIRAALAEYPLITKPFKPMYLLQRVRAVIDGMPHQGRGRP